MRGGRRVKKGREEGEEGREEGEGRQFWQKKRRKKEKNVARAKRVPLQEGRR